MAEDFWVLARLQRESRFKATLSMPPFRAAASPSPRQTRTGKYLYDYLRFWRFMVLRPLSWAKGGCREATSEISQTRQCLVTRPNEFVLKGRWTGRRLPSTNLSGRGIVWDTASHFASDESILKNNVAVMAEDFWVLARLQRESRFKATLSMPPFRAAASPSPRQTRTGKYLYDYLRFWGFMVLRPLSWAKGGCREATSEISQTRQCLVTRPNEFVLKGRRTGRRLPSSNLSGRGIVWDAASQFVAGYRHFKE